MKKLRHVREKLSSSLWFLPTLLVVGAVLLAVGLIGADSAIDQKRLAQSWPRLFGANAEGSRSLLSAIATSMITVAGVGFSITVVALTLAASQYTSRVMSNFMRDHGNQTVLGVFLGVFAYSLVVLRSVRGEGDREGAFVPALSVLGAMLLAFIAVGFLIFFIHHIASSIQARSIVATAAAKTLQTIDSLFPAGEGDSAAENRPGEPAGRAWAPVPARRSGYIQDVHVGGLCDAARRRGVSVRMVHGVGAFVIEACPLAEVAGGRPDDGLVREINAACVIGTERTLDHDPGYGIRQIVDVALKALSPGINDTTTAVNCVDYLGVILVRLAGRRIEIPGRFDGNELRVALQQPSFSALVAEAVDQIRQNAERNPAVLARLLAMLDIVATQTKDEHRLQALRQHASLVLETAERGIPSAHDRRTVWAAAGSIGATVD